MVFTKEHTLVIYNNKNEPGKNDATGAFIPEAKKFAEVHKVLSEDMLGVACPGMAKAERQRRVLEFLKTSLARKPIDMIAWFCHGWSQGIQLGFSKQDVPKLMGVLGASGTLTGTGAASSLSQVLYCCSTASESKNSRQSNAPGTDGGFADCLRDYAVKGGFRGGWVDAHLMPGHTTQNPFVMRFFIEEPFEGEWDLPGGDWVVSPKNPLWKEWKRKVQQPNSDFRYLFPYMTVGDIHERCGQVWG